MPNLTKHQSSEFTKLMLMGDPKSGKTGSMASLVKKFNLRILDFDNGLDILSQLVGRDAHDRLESVEFRTLRDKMKSTPLGPIVDGQATAFIEALRMLDNWKYDNT